MSDKVINQIRALRDFHNIILEGVGNIQFTQDDTFTFSISAEEHLLDLIETSVTEGNLLIAIKKNVQNFNAKEPIQYTITAPELRNVKISGSGSFTTSTLIGNTFTLDTPGSSKVKIDTLDITSVSLNTKGSIKCQIDHITANVLALDIIGSGTFILPDLKLQSFSSNIKGSGKIQAIGAANVVTISSTGTTQLDASKLACEIATVESPGLGNITVSVSEKLTAHISGMGTIRYYGNPTVSKHISGMGNIKRLGDIPMQVV